MKIAVYDRNNKERLLGQLEVKSYSFRSPRYDEVAAEYKTSLMTQRRIMTPSPQCPSLKLLTFYVDVRSVSDRKVIDEATTETTIIERKCFLTDALLSDLMKLDRFYLPDETPVEQRRRLFEASRRDFY